MDRFFRVNWRLEIGNTPDEKFEAGREISIDASNEQLIDDWLKVGVITEIEPPAEVKTQTTNTPQGDDPAPDVPLPGAGEPDLTKAAAPAAPAPKPTIPAKPEKPGPIKPVKKPKR